MGDDDRAFRPASWQVPPGDAASTVVGAIPLVGLVVCFALPAYLAVIVVFGILGTVTANRGERYRYPVARRLIS